MKSLLDIVGIVILKDLICHGGDLSLLKGEKEALILVMIVTALFKCP
jgi:hypothetical protein